ncbi:MAG TPA: hypothetical protein VFA04_09215 [Bryobacteraceae bacterium]|nr:hypothetical protein [Bryobacteraceae bacterium]
MLKPSYKITLGTSTVGSSQIGPVAALQVRRDKRGRADEAIVRLGTTVAVDFAEGDAASIELGWDGATTAVFTGTVDRIVRGISHTEAYCTGMQMKMMRSRTDQVFVSQNAGQVVTALAGTAGVDIDTADDGIDLPVYVADSTRTLFAHCSTLARLCGFDLYTNAEGELVFSALTTTSADHTVRYGAEILGVSVETTAPLDACNVFPESPASSAGDDKASWLVKDPSPHEGTAGSGSDSVLFSDPVLRTRDAAESAAKARLYFSQRDATSGELELMGAPDVEIGETVEIKGVPTPDVDGLYQIMAVVHRLDARRGFRTMVALGGMP